MKKVEMLDFHPAFKNLQAPVKRQPFLEKAISGCLFLSISCTSYISTDSHKTWERKTSPVLRGRKRPSVILIGFFIPVQLRGPWGTETLNKTPSLEVIFARFWWRSQTYTPGSSPWILLQADTWNVSWNGWSTVHIHLPPLPLVWDPHTPPFYIQHSNRMIWKMWLSFHSWRQRPRRLSYVKNFSIEFSLEFSLLSLAPPALWKFCLLKKLCII